MTAYYNEIDPFAAAWLKELIKAGHIAPGEVDTRSIEDVRADDLRGFTQCHFFAGIGVWSYALRCAGWPDDRPVWTGSCPCQPFSAAGKRGGTSDERHLWPAWHHLIEICRPATVFGEQVASKDGLAWLDLVHADLEGSGYAVGCLDLCAAGFGAPHIRQRIYFVADALRSGTTYGPGEGVGAQATPDGKDGDLQGQRLRSGEQGPARLLADTEHDGQHRQGGFEAEQIRDEQDEWLPVGNCEPRLLADAAPERIDGSGNGGPGRRGESSDHCELGNADSPSPSRLGEDGGQGEAQGRLRCGPCNGFWSDAVWLPCRDGKARPVGVEFMDNPSSPRCNGEGKGSEGEARDEARLRGPECGCSPDRGELGNASSRGRRKRGNEAQPGSGGHADGTDEPDVMVDTIQPGLEGHAGDGTGCLRQEREVQEQDRPTGEADIFDGVAVPDRDGRPEGRLSVRSGRSRQAKIEQCGGGPTNGFWRDAIWLPCRDGKARPVEPCVEPMADGIAGDLGLVRLESYPDHPHKERIIYAPLIQKGKARVGRLRGYGNAIVCPVATEFIRAYMEVLHD